MKRDPTNPDQRGFVTVTSVPDNSDSLPRPAGESPLHGRGWLRRVRRGAVGGVLLVVGFLVFYALFLLVGLIPVNRGWAPPDEGVEVFLLEDPVHTDLIFPISNDHWDWGERIPRSDFPDRADGATHYAIGWGDRGFYLETPTWAELETSTALLAMFWPSKTVMHVTAVTDPSVGERTVRITLSAEQYRQLCGLVAASFEGRGDPRQIAFSYRQTDAFYEAIGAYHCFYTCNSWAGAKLRSVGVSTPLFTPLPGQVGMYLE